VRGSSLADHEPHRAETRQRLWPSCEPGFHTSVRTKRRLTVATRQLRGACPGSSRFPGSGSPCANRGLSAACEQSRIVRLCSIPAIPTDLQRNAPIAEPCRPDPWQANIAPLPVIPEHGHPPCAGTKLSRSAAVEPRPPCPACRSPGVLHEQSSIVGLCSIPSSPIDLQQLPLHVARPLVAWTIARPLLFGPLLASTASPSAMKELAARSAIEPRFPVRGATGTTALPRLPIFGSATGALRERNHSV
jgi:hypothetical protein